MLSGINLPHFRHLQPGVGSPPPISSNLPPETFSSSSSAILPELVPSCLKTHPLFLLSFQCHFLLQMPKVLRVFSFFLLFPIILCSVPLFFSFHRQLGGDSTFQSFFNIFISELLVFIFVLKSTFLSFILVSSSFLIFSYNDPSLIILSESDRSNLIAMSCCL